MRLPKRNGQGGVVGWLGTYTDFDDRKRAFDAAERAIRVRDEFLSIASHELRTPLMTLDLRLKSSRRGPHQDGRCAPTRFPASSRRRCADDRLIGLVDDLLDVSRVNNGQLSLHRGSFDMADAAREVIDQLAETAAGAGCCESCFEVGSPVVGGWDRSRIEQVFRNLLSNALKYAPKSEIRRLCRRTERARGRRGARSRDGHRREGRATHLRPVRAGRPPRNYGGLGLGLFIVQQIARAHAGEARVESKLGEGSRFWIELPFESGSGVHGTLSENDTARAGSAR